MNLALRNGRDHHPDLGFPELHQRSGESEAKLYDPYLSLDFCGSCDGVNLSRELVW